MPNINKEKLLSTKSLVESPMILLKIGGYIMCLASLVQLFFIY